ncbi:TetR/AcrR family transcriptional regulator [Gordonia rubripertincta]|uniref:TetR/AcrR family transcriptional regulator n=1 Tax=Gordonia rubripertincta TaxID=36822 RepID=A0ABT4MVN3_GORRU|nr:TetR/AcrR family transcriptional regulator [Gordonia rubripertincta]MCZ4551070.1 TetR/AcrR family transcriptional regulator [Gordonia rubripertincta]
MNREQSILEAAERLFSERNFDGVGVDAIGAEAGISGSAIYRHFSNKEEILAVLFDRAADELLMRVGEPKTDPVAELEQLIAAHIDFALSHEGLSKIWTREQHSLTGIRQRSLMRRQRPYIDRWVAALNSNFPGHPHEDLTAVVRAIHGLITSDSTRPKSVKRSDNTRQLLTVLANAAVSGLDMGGKK